MSLKYFRMLGGTYQIPHRQHIVKLRGHGVVLHGHEEGVEHNADSDSQVNKRVHHNKVYPLFKDHPGGTAVPLQEKVSKFVPARWAWPLSLLQL